MWEQIDTDRWHQPPWTDDSGYTSPRHLLLKAGDRLIELHRTTVHIYQVGGDIDPVRPLSDAQWQQSVEDADVPVGDDEPTWQALSQLAG
jgi:hypothetical protein